METITLNKREANHLTATHAIRLCHPTLGRKYQRSFKVNRVMGVREPFYPGINLCLWIQGDKVIKREAYNGYCFLDGKWFFPNMPVWERSENPPTFQEKVITENTGKACSGALLLDEGIRRYVKVERITTQRIQDMTEEDAMACGYYDDPHAVMDSPLEQFSQDWEKTFGKSKAYPLKWYDNPELVVVELCETTLF